MKEKATDDNLLCLVTTYNPDNPQVFQLVKKTLPMLNQNSSSKSMMSKTKVIHSQRQPRNLKRMLTNSYFFIQNDTDVWNKTVQNMPYLRTFALIVCAQLFCAGNATVICHASLRLTGPECKHGVENAWEKNSGRDYSFGSSVTPIFFKHESLTLLAIHKI